MPLNKNAFVRIRCIDTMLRNNKFVKTSHIINKLHERHDLTVGERTIHKDIKDMETEFHAPIEYSNSEKAYYYPDDVESIFPAFELQDEEVYALTFYAKILQQYKNFNIFKDFSSAIDKVVDAVNIKNSQIKVSEQILIQPENLPAFQGSELIPTIISSFDTKKKIQFDYCKHNSEEVKKHIISPIMLKEYDNLWYLIGKKDSKNNVTTFALDRITNFQVLTDDIETEIKFNADEYFNHAFGIFVPDGKVENVILEFEKWRGNYLLKAPIHRTQEFIKEEKDKMYFKFQVIPYHELHAKILSYGQHVKVIEPESLKKEIKNLLEETLKNY